MILSSKPQRTWESVPRFHGMRSCASEIMAEAVRMLARLEGILMDPVYTGKAMAGFIDLIRKGFFRKEENILFVHTGGSPALHAYMKEVLS